MVFFQKQNLKKYQMIFVIITLMISNFNLQKMYILSDLTSKTRFLTGAGNSGEDVVSLYLMKTGCEGVGGLNKIGEPDICSSSRNLTLTQHYEPFSFNITTTKEGINITGLKGTDIEYPTDLPEGQYLGKNSGTSYSTPIRAAKLALNKMMEGVV